MNFSRNSVRLSIISTLCQLKIAEINLAKYIRPTENEKLQSRIRELEFVPPEESTTQCRIYYIHL